MAERSGFFNALYTDGVYDRKYNANDYCDNLAVVIGNGVLRSDADDLRVTSSGMVVSVAAGRAWINGHYYYNDAEISFAATTAPTGGARWDRIMLRLDTQVGVRSINLRYVQGTAANNPAKPEPVRSGTIYELVLADIYVGTNVTSVQVTDTRSDAAICGWVFSTRGNEDFFKALDKEYAEWFADKKNNLASVTLFKRYNWHTQLSSAASVVAFNIPQFDEETTFIEVYVNGILEHEGIDYTRSGSILTFKNSLVAGTEIIVKAFKSIDGTGIESVADEITQLQNAVAAMNTSADYDYMCNGVDDNVQLSLLAKAWLEGGDDYSSKTIRVYGTFGAQAPYSGDGDFLLPYEWLDIGGYKDYSRRIVFDFSCCSQLTFPVAAGSVNYLFYGKNAHIVGADVYAYQKGTDTIIIGFSSTNGAVYAENCSFWITGYTTSKIACTGTFKNCRGSVANTTGISCCFDTLGTCLLRLYGGEYMAYTGSSSSVSAVVRHGASSTKAASILNGVNAPTVARDGYYQTNAIYQESGGGILNCRDLVSALGVVLISGSSTISGTIAYSKPNVM